MVGQLENGGVIELAPKYHRIGRGVPRHNH